MDKKLTVMEMAKYLGVSKEAIYNRLRRGSLESIMEDGKKYVLLTPNVQREGKLPKRAAITNELNHEYIDLLKAQVQELKEKNEKLENDKEKLQLEKEQMLIESKEKIEQIYKDRDEQLKTILSLANIPTLQHKMEEDTIEVVEEVEIEEDIVEKICGTYSDWISLKEYLKEKNYTKEERKAIKKRIKKQVGVSLHVKSLDDELFVKKDIKLKNIIGKV